VAKSSVFNNGVVDISYDGLNFTEQVDTGLGEEITRIHAAGGRAFVFSGVSRGRSTADGRNWEEISGLIPNGVQVNDVAYSNGAWCFAYQNGISRSTDGINLATITVPSRTRYGIAARGDTFVAGGTNRTIS